MIGSKNGNWKGGISSFKRADDLLSLSDEARAEIRKRLMSQYRVDTITGCWIWTGKTLNKGERACLTLGHNNHLAYRLMYVLTNGKLGSLLVLHECDNGLCINPEHLKKGTNAENSRDMVQKQRQARGERNSRAKLTQEQVDAIRAEVGNRRLYGIRKAIAKKYGVDPETISRVVLRRNWT